MNGLAVNIRQEKKFLWIVLGVITFLWMSLQPGLVQPASAATVGLKAWPGLAGLYKQDQMVQVRVEIDNTGSPFQGQLEVGRKAKPNITEDNVPVYRQDMEIPSGKTETMMFVPGEILGDAEIRLLIDGKISARSLIQGTNVDGMMALVIDEKTYRSDFFNWLDKALNNQLQIKYISPQELPENVLLLQGVDLLVVGPESMATLSAQQCKAITEWTRLGGNLLLSQGAGAAPEGAFHVITPVEVTGSTTVNGSMGGLREAQGSLPAVTGRVLQGQVLVSDNGVPLLVKGEAGKGQVLYSAVPLEALNGGNDKVWQTLYGSDVEIFSSKGDWLQGNLRHASTYIPSLELPLTGVSLIWLLYLILVGPGLYWLLKRLDKRDYAWFLIPAAAVVVAIGMYLFSPVNRLHNYLRQDIAVLDIITPELAKVNAASTIVMPQGGDLALQSTNSEMWLHPYSNYNTNKAEVMVTDKDAKIFFPQVEYGSMRQVSAFGVLQNVGSLTGSIYLQDGMVKGTVTNATQMDLQNCSLLVSGFRIDMGDLKQGQSKEIEEQLDKWQYIEDWQADRYETDENRSWERDLLNNNVLTDLNSQSYNAQAVWIGWVNETPALFEVQKPAGQAEYHGKMLVKQNIAILFPAGSFDIQPGLLRPDIDNTSGGSYEMNSNGIILYGGKINVTYSLASVLHHRQYTVNRIVLGSGGNVQTIEVFNQMENSWEAYEPGQELEQTKLPAYLSPQGTIILRIGKSMDDDSFESTIFKGIAVNGVVEE